MNVFDLIVKALGPEYFERHAKSNMTLEKFELRDSFLKDALESLTDWEFILKIDALLETASKHILAKNLGVSKKVVDEMTGGSHIATPLLEMKIINKETSELIKTVRRIRNKFAHDISYVEKDLCHVLHVEENNNTARKRAIKSLVGRELGDMEWEDLRQDEVMKKVIRRLIVKGVIDFLAIVYDEEAKEVKNK